MMTKALRTAAIAGAVLAIPFAGAFAAGPNGNWFTQGGTAMVRIANCGNAICGTIVKLKEPNDPATAKPKLDKHNADASKRSRPVVGIRIVLGMKPSGTPNKWIGQVYNAEDCKTYSGSLTLQNANTIKLEGCVLGGLICKAQTWKRAS